MVDVQLPESLRDVEAIRSVRTPAELRYQFTAGDANTRFLRAITEKRIVGQQAPGGKVYVPPRGADPELGQPTPSRWRWPRWAPSPRSAWSTSSSTAPPWRSRT